MHMGGYDSAVEKESVDCVSIVEKSIDDNEFRSPLHCGNMFSIQCPFEKRENELKIGKRAKIRFFFSQIPISTFLYDDLSKTSSTITYP